MIIIHGENTTNSRQKLFEIIEDYKSKNLEVTRISAKQLSEAMLEEVLGASDLFGTAKLIVIEELHSLPTSKKKKYFLDLVSKAQIHKVVLWEKRSLTATMIKKFENAQVFEFKISKTLFSWLELLGTSGNDQKKLKLLHSAIEIDGEFFCFLMLIRQIRQLIQIKSGGNPGGAPFMVAKISSQASKFSLEQLLDIYKKLLKIDLKTKTSNILISETTMLDLLSLKL